MSSTNQPPLPLPLDTGRLNLHNINQGVVNAQYAVRGALAIRAEELREQLKANPGSLPFDKVINCNIGNPQQLDQKPLTFIRQVLALAQYPDLLNNKDALKAFSQTAISRAKYLLDQVNSVGAYSVSQGVPAIRKSVANFIERRDGHPADINDIFLTAGASLGITDILTVICAHPKTGIMIPVPQYPLYSATLSVLDASPVPYYLDESSAWGTSPDEIAQRYAVAEQMGIVPRALVVVNPGNPTGSVLSKEDMYAIIRFAATKGLVLMADEVYQSNIYTDSVRFVSFKKALRDLQSEVSGEEAEELAGLQLVSFHSVSKGMLGECGQRGGYFEMIGIDPAVRQQIYKLVSVRLCPVVTGQFVVDCMVNPPQPGDDAYDQYIAEYEGIKNELRDRALALHAAFEKMEGVTCAPPEGAMYLFPTITLPQKAIQQAEKQGVAPDALYCMELLNSTGICVVPGSGFGQRPGTFHFRTTFLAPGVEYAKSIADFHKAFMAKYK
ncbi:hypothetical protein CANCADRAFT_23530 [Tortispora caseinolytica NRRL Y-17796]|uniref:Glutamate pyruvate transaminase n=1 Tax=Tortispora caseinolytica NRRL Y-17796 TaxID=767744 RepID=A0A1E4TJA7_9ASCO|nr:hypothetical protein CANCADRAFT_23530 [Tortispora caseinolytica NRRL Y-17796]